MIDKENVVAISRLKYYINDFGMVYVGDRQGEDRLATEEEINKSRGIDPQSYLNQLNNWIAEENLRIANNLSQDLSYGLTLEEAQEFAAEDTEAVTAEYAEKLAIIQAGGNPFEEVQK